ncbi:Hypothetical predicted protein, partial [Marmota monax]
SGAKRRLRAREGGSSIPKEKNEQAEPECAGALETGPVGAALLQAMMQAELWAIP